METAEENKKEPGEDQIAEIDRLKQELQREHESYLRALADYDNYRRRSERECSAAARSGKREIILSLLELLDGYDRALQHMDEAPPGLAKGLEALHRNFLNLLQAHGVTPIHSVGEVFNPELHDAIGLLERDDIESGRVAEEVQRGYRWGDELLRPARVRVAK